MFIMSRPSQHPALALNRVKNIVPRLLLLVCALITVKSLYAAPQSPPTATIFGNWIIDSPEQITLLQLTRDQSYLYIQLNLIEPQNSVAEWGRIDIQQADVHFFPSYSSNQQQGLVAYQIAHPKLHIALTVESARLVFSIDTNGDSVADEQHHYDITPSQSVYGVWHQLSTPALSSLVLFDNSYYAMVKINLHQDPQANEHVTHLQWGRFELHQNQLTFEPVFNSHPQHTSNLPSTSPNMVYQPNKQQLTLSFMGKGNLNDIEMNQQYEH
jgi:hypothetical protein